MIALKNKISLGEASDNGYLKRFITMDCKLCLTIEKYVTILFEQIPVPSLKYHTLLHTQTVVRNAMLIAENLTISENEKFILFAAAWFHDIGFLFVDAKFHEEEGCIIMQNFLSLKIENKTIINEIEHCIMATKAPVDPQNLLQKIICDADVYHFGTKEFEGNNKLVFEELNLKNQHNDILKFKENTLSMLINHRFYTKYCKDILSKQKNKNITALENIIVKYEQK